MSKGWLAACWRSLFMMPDGRGFFKSLDDAALLEVSLLPADNSKDFRLPSRPKEPQTI